MFRPLARSYRRPPRRGTSFTLIVVVMISLAASVGVAFALFAGQTLRTNVAIKEGQGGGALQLPRGPDPSGTLNRFFTALLFDAGDDAPEDVTNALRGHSIARSMYGRDVAIYGTPGLFNTTPWNGVGMFREDMAAYGVPGLTGDRGAQVNNTKMLIGPPGSAVQVLIDPEYTGLRPRDAAGNLIGPFDLAHAATRTYIGRNAGYSFADLKNFFEGAVDPATGQVLTPSFHRPWLWNSQIPGPGGVPILTTLDPNNPNWTNTPGRFLALRPRPGTAAEPEHPLFPRVPPNADGTFTGDVQNWPGGFVYDFDPAFPGDATRKKYYARNDSLWMYLGQQPVRFANRRVIPMVAALIVPLDGLLNVNAHGNNYGTGGAHLSYAGHGPWEVNLAGVLGTDWPTVLGGTNGRVTAPPLMARSGAVSRAYEPSRNGPLPAFSPVAWNANAVTRPAYPAGANLTGVPGFAAANFQSTNNAEPAHPALYNGTDWGTAGSPRAFPISDVKRLHLRYAFSPDWYAASDVASTAVAPNDLFGNPTDPTGPPGNTNFQFVYATGVNTYNGYRLNPAHTNRALVTPRSNSLDRPKIAPNFANRDGPLALALLPTQKPGPVFASPFPMPGTPRGMTFTDFPADNRWVNRMAVLGTVDVNRPLPDYRVNPAQPLSATNVNAATVALADADRRKLAHDIFVRLAAATGAGLNIGLTPTTYPLAPLPQPQYTVDPTIVPGSPQYNALRYLAQLAVNIVDFRDDDDISTAFVWNPDPGFPDPYNAANFAAGAINNRVVFGVEKPRLVLNEVYSELTNAPTDPVNGADANGDGIPDGLMAGSQAHVKFWAELLNPTNATPPIIPPPPPGTPSVAVADQVPLSAYQIQIARAFRTTGGVEDRRTFLYNAGNSIGNFGGSADATFTFTTASPGGPTQVGPNNGNYTIAGSLPAGGIVLAGPPVTPVKAGSAEYNPSTGNWANANTLRTPGLAPAGAPVGGMGYTLVMPAAGVVNPATAEFRHHIVLLRRTPNPYLPANVTDNQFVTVDMMDYVPSFDVLHRDVDQGTSRRQRPLDANGYDPNTTRYSVGKVQAYAGQSATVVPPANGPGVYNNYLFPSSMVLDQRPSTPDPEMNAPRNTFARHNGTSNTTAPANTFTPGTPASLAGGETIMTPFDWMVHLDRAVTSEIELFQVRDTAPHRVTERFLLGPPVAPAAIPGVTYENGFAQWRSTDNGIARALEFLTVKPFTANVAHGGRAPGKINVNPLPDKRVLSALLDPQAGNEFNNAFVDSNAWAQWVNSRNFDPTVVPGGAGVIPRQLANGTAVAQTAVAPTQTIHEGAATAPAGPNRPFLPWGAPAATGSPAPFAAYPNGGGENQTILRYNPADPNRVPYLYTGLPTDTTVMPPRTRYGAVSTPPEPVRKMMNNVTTVSHTYAVFLTISYFEQDFQTVSPTSGQRDGVIDLGGGVFMPRIAQEAYLNVPGDLRQKFVGVIDMTGMAIDPTTNAPPTVTPFFTTLAATARTGDTTISVVTDNLSATVTTDGVAVPLMPMATGSKLVLGYGTEEQVVNILSVTTPPPPPGQPTVTVVTLDPTTPLLRTAWGGSSVSNVRPGYPGVQGGNFKYNDPAAKPVLPYIERVR